MKTTKQEIFMTTNKLQQLWEQRLVSRGLAPLENITVETQQEYILQPFRNSFDASELVEGAPINPRDAVPSHDGYTTYSPLDTDDILFAILANAGDDNELSELALRALKDHHLDRHSIRANVSIHVLTRAITARS